jgi:hypothetical protein
MSAAKASQQSPVDAVQAIFEALEPLNAETRLRILASATSLLGMSLPTASPGTPAGGPPSTESTGAGWLGLRPTCRATPLARCRDFA